MEEQKCFEVSLHDEIDQHGYNYSSQFPKEKKPLEGWEWGRPEDLQGLKMILLFPNGMTVSEKIFKTESSKGNFETSKAACSKVGGLLASPRNSAENSAIQQIAARHKKMPFLGINDIQTEGTFKHLNGEALGYSNWALNKPDNSEGIEDCVEVRPSGKWNDKSCAEKQLIICEY
uniref:C-type lectin domain-containing protein n=1 Tax=Chrysemys picta bellii TaxID=8478 RepID=A0A8C3FIG2_CHRPI